MEYSSKIEKMADVFILIMDLNEILHQFAMVNRLRLCGHVLRRDDGHVLKRAFEVEWQRKKGMAEVG